jgi:hypothetical protein
VGAKTDQHRTIGISRMLAMSLPHELADVHHIMTCHVSEARVTDVRVVLPHNRF